MIGCVASSSRLDDAKSKDELAAVWDVLSMRLDAHADAEETVFLSGLAEARRSRRPRAILKVTPRTKPKTRSPITTRFEMRCASRVSTMRVPRSGSKP